MIYAKIKTILKRNVRMKTKSIITIMIMCVISYVHVYSMAPNRLLNDEEIEFRLALTRNRNIDINQLNTILRNHRHNIDLDVLLHDRHNPTYLNLAVTLMSLPAVQLLIDNRANVNFRNPINNISFGAFNYHSYNPQASTDDIDRICLSIIQALVEAGADINYISVDRLHANYGKTLLHILVEENFVQSALYVLGRLEGHPLPDEVMPADTTLTDRFGETPLKLAENMYGEDSDIYQAIMDTVQLW